jgi:hypothetical protein
VNLRDVIGVSLISAFIGAMGALFWKAIPPANEQLLVYMLGQLSGFAAAVVSFHYVMKSGEKEADAKRAELELKRADNTGAAFEAIKVAAATAPPSGDDQATAAAMEVAGAATDKADQIAEEN